jgi:hypothetical protein
MVVYSHGRQEFDIWKCTGRVVQSIKDHLCDKYHIQNDRSHKWTSRPDFFSILLIDKMAEDGVILPIFLGPMIMGYIIFALLESPQNHYKSEKQRNTYIL